MDRLWTQFALGLISGFGITFGGFAYKLGLTFGAIIFLIAIAFMVVAGVLRHQWRPE